MALTKDHLQAIGALVAGVVEASEKRLEKRLEDVRTEMRHLFK
jgi:hypothetical protein